MKKLITLLLVLALLVPMCLVANADVAAKPFYGLGTADFDRDKFPNMEGCATLSISYIGDIISISYGGGKVTAGSIDDAQVEKLATALKKEMDKRPEGMRYIHYSGVSQAYDLAPEDAVYLDFAVDQITEINEAIFKKYAELGGKVEGAIMFTLHTGMSAYYINTNDAKKDAKIYGKIVKDPRYATEIRPLLAERGFVFYDGNITDYTPEIYGISGKAGAKYANCQAIWNAVMSTRLNAYTTEWCYEPMAKYFPNVHVSDYQATDVDAWMKPVNNDGDVKGGGGNVFRPGNTSCENFYSGRPTDSFFKESTTPVFKSMPTYMGAVYEKSSFNSFKYDMNVAKQVYLATDDGNVCYWVSRYSTAKDSNTEISNTPYYSEQVYHLNLLDPKPFVVFQNREGMTQEQIDLCTQVPNELLQELNRVAGYADRKPIAMPVNWNSDFVISGMYANGRNIWRITPNRDVISKEAFKVKGSDPTFSVSGQTVSFPGGHIIEDTAISEIGTYGYWVETAANVTPVIVNDADRFAKKPAYLEDYESYKENTKLLAANLRDLGGWTVQPKGSDLLIVNDGKDKALSITGDSLLENKLIPANVTVGDEYAKKQSWEITVTVPAGIAEDAQITLLNYDGDMDDTDGGFVIKGNTLYYGTGEMDEEFEPVYAELMELKPGTYTLRRDLNFGQTFYCDYSVLSGDKVVKTAQKVKIPTFKGKVQSVGIKCDNMNQRLILDDYTLRATSAAADLYLYDTALGLKLDNDAKQTKSTTYRLSWANASKQTETAAVKADITSGGKTTTKTLKSVTLNPGCDGVEYGTVDVKAGETVKIYLDSSIKDEKLDLNPTQPTEAPEQTQATKQTQATQATSATKATKPASSKLTRPTQATQATKQTEATKPAETKAPTQATKPVATKAPNVTELTEATGATAVTEVTQVTELTEATQATEATEATEATTPDKSDDDTGKKGPNVGLIIAIVVVVLAAAGAACWYLFIFKKKKTNA